MKNSISQAAIAALVLAAGAALAQSNMKPMPGDMGMEHMQGMSMEHMQGMEPKGAMSDSTKAYMQAMGGMHKGMDITYSGDADIDFARGMTPHHQGAIEMAKVELQFGKSPEMRKLAESIVKAQEDEIAEMKAWLSKNEK